MIRCVIFFGNRVHTADEQFDEWSEQHPDVAVWDAQYQQTSSNEHSICVFYEED